MKERVWKVLTVTQCKRERRRERGLKAGRDRERKTMMSIDRGEPIIYSEHTENTRTHKHRLREQHMHKCKKRQRNMPTHTFICILMYLSPLPVKTINTITLMCSLTELQNTVSRQNYAHKHIQICVCFIALRSHTVRYPKSIHPHSYTHTNLPWLKLTFFTDAKTHRCRQTQHFQYPLLQHSSKHNLTCKFSVPFTRSSV